MNEGKTSMTGEKFEAMTPEALETKLSEEFPKDATCWSQAGDEVRDMCRGARLLAGVGADGALDFSALGSPAEWNAQGVAATVKFYRVMKEEKRQEFWADFGHMLGVAGDDA